MTFTLIWRYGASSGHDEIPDETLDKLLGEFDEDPDDVEHGDVWLADNRSGWSLGAFAGDDWLVVLENDEGDDGPFHRRGLTRPEVFALFRRVADGEMEAVRAEGWPAGYGS
ncbi:hypothetical protein [Actinoplanes sp. HUAS TT8]|uniref:hypothetical protein n=1 Tax=Actinoplanes sp. HUAS TT8 TaxID=3447453 RepID=UPI003F51B32C